MTDQAATATAIVATGVVLAVTYWLMAYVWLRRQVGQMRAVLALALGVSVMHVITGPFFVPYHWSLLDGCFAMAGLLLLNRLTITRMRWLLVLIAVATLNRETALIIAIWGVARTVQAQRHRGYAAMGVLVWATVYGAIRLGIDAPPRADMWSLPATLRVNMTISTLPHLIFYLGPAWLLALRGMIIDRDRRWVAVGVASLLVLFLVFARWGETRILYPVLPALLVWIVHPTRDNAG